MSGPTITVSIVSHGHAALLEQLLRSLAEHCCGDLHIVITQNVPEPAPAALVPFPCEFIRNASARGFGDNHNAAFRRARGEYFCVLNPDIRLTCDPFPPLLEVLAAHRNAGVVAPLVMNPAGELEDSARDFPTPWSITKKFLGRSRDRESLRTRLSAEPLPVDWVAGMFMLFPAAVFREIGGFDPAYFLYYEDVDLCSRLRARSREVLLSPAVRVVHDARRESHRNLRYLRWHLSSMLRFFALHFLRQNRKAP